ncbi:MAG: extensin family protein, partial [Tabrizicola sp.]|nr:extensin family protein [Tabrizicola sp.]
QRPLPNPAYAVPLATGVPVEPGMTSLRPKARPRQPFEKVAAARALARSEAEVALLAPPPEVEDLSEVTPRKKRKRKEKVSARGSVCGVPEIKGEVIAPIKSRINGCGVAEPVRITSVSGVALSQSPTIDCPTAQALNVWVRDVVQPALGGEVVQLEVAAHYICRSRNNVKGAKISEHGKGKAIDVSAFVLSNGKVLTVLNNYNKTLRKIHRAACGIFKTTLGPGSDGYHENHFHLDTASHRSGTYCR